MEQTITKPRYVYSKERGIRILKEGADFLLYSTKYPSARLIKKPPTAATLERWAMDGVSKAIDGCTVEPDGYCRHQQPSWLIVMGLI